MYFYVFLKKMQNFKPCENTFYSLTLIEGEKHTSEFTKTKEMFLLLKRHTNNIICKISKIILLF